MNYEKNLKAIFNTIEQYPECDVAKRYRLAVKENNIEQYKEKDYYFYCKLMQIISRVYQKGMFDCVLNRYQFLNNKYSNIKRVGEELREEVLYQKENHRKYILSLDTSIPKLTPIINNVILQISSDEIVYDFFKLKEIIENEYNLTTSNLFSGLEKQYLDEILGKEFGFTKEELEKAYNLPTTEENLPSYLLEHLKIYTEGLVPYINHWHFLLDHDFKKEFKQSISKMNIEPLIYENNYLKKIRSIYALECSHKNQKINFYIEW